MIGMGRQADAPSFMGSALESAARAAESWLRLTADFLTRTWMPPQLEPPVESVHRWTGWCVRQMKFGVMSV